jgi:excisionase family DNA binding protein
MAKRKQKLEIVPSATPRVSAPIEFPLTGQEVAERLKVKPSTVYELTRRRNRRPMPFVKVGKYLRFYWSEIETWMRESRDAA